MANTCPKCHSDNPDGSRFCADCGTRLFPGDDFSVGPTETIEAPKDEPGGVGGGEGLSSYHLSNQINSSQKEGVMVNQETIVRVLREDDLPAIIEIDACASGSPRPDYLKGKMKAALDRDLGIVFSLVIESDNRVAGFLIGEVYRGEFGIPEDVATVDTVGVHPDFQGQGLGRQLMEEFVSHARKVGVERIRTLVDWYQQWDLMGFFRSTGFFPAKTNIILERVIKQ